MAVLSVENKIPDADHQNITDAVVSVRTKNIQALTVFTESINVNKHYWNTNELMSPLELFTSTSAVCYSRQ
jgi:hypothetical protein